MTIELNHVFKNVPLVSRYSGEERSFLVFGLTWINTWDHPLKTIATGSVKMIDSEGYQTSSDLCEYHEYTHYVNPKSKEKIDIFLPWPELEPEAKAKTDGWIWFNSIAKREPKKLILKVNIFNPGNTSGLVRDFEVFEFIFSSISS